MKYMRRTAGYTWTDYKTNTQITKELKITNFGQITGIQEKLDTTCKYRVIHKSVKHFKNSQQIDYATDHGNSYVDRERNF